MSDIKENIVNGDISYTAHWHKTYIIAITKH